MNQLKLPFSIILFLFASLYFFAHVFGPIPFFVQSIQTTKTNLFQVSGEGKASAIPNTATLSFGVTKTAAIVSAAQNQTDSAVTNILNSIKSLSIDTKDITTTNYSVNPNYDYALGNQTTTGYTVTQSIEVKVSPIEKASKAIDIVTQNGANMVGGLTFTLDDKTMQDTQGKARQQAIDNAKKKAQSLSQAAGMHLGKIIDVEENVQSTPLPIRAGALLKTDTAISAPTQLPTGESTYVTTVTLSYETY